MLGLTLPSQPQRVILVQLNVLVLLFEQPEKPDDLGILLAGARLPTGIGFDVCADRHGDRIFAEAARFAGRGLPLAPPQIGKLANHPERLVRPAQRGDRLGVAGPDDEIVAKGIRIVRLGSGDLLGFRVPVASKASASRAPSLGSSIRRVVASE